MTTKYPLSEAEATQPASHGSSTRFGYRVEARFNYPQPKVILGVALGKEWQTLNVFPGAPGHDVALSSGNHDLHGHSLFTYTEAEALRWQFLAAARASSDPAFCLETRLVCFKLESSYSYKAESIVNPLNYRGEVPADFFPDRAP
jgi:hypothetical protein